MAEQDSEVVVSEQAAEQAGFDAADSGEQLQTETTETPPTPVEPPAPEPKIIQLTEEDFNRFNTAATQVDSVRAEMQKSMGTAFGKMGFLETTLKQLQAATPAGQSVEVTDDMVSELKEEFPELGALVLKSLQKMAGKIKGVGPAAPPTVDHSQIESQVSARVIALQEEALVDEYPNWREIVGSPEVTGGPIPQTDYRKWMATQPQDYQQRLNNTNSASVIARSITKFNEAKAAAAKAKPPVSQKSSARQALIRENVQPRSDGGRPPSEPNSEVAAFNAVFGS